MKRRRIGSDARDSKERRRNTGARSAVKVEGSDVGLVTRGGPGRASSRVEVVGGGVGEEVGSAGNVRSKAGEGGYDDDDGDVDADARRLWLRMKMRMRRGVRALGAADRERP